MLPQRSSPDAVEPPLDRDQTIDTAATTQSVAQLAVLRLGGASLVPQLLCAVLRNARPSLCLLTGRPRGAARLSATLHPARRDRAGPPRLKVVGLHGAHSGSGGRGKQRSGCPAARRADGGGQDVSGARARRSICVLEVNPSFRRGYVALRDAVVDATQSQGMKEEDNDKGDKRRTTLILLDEDDNLALTRLG